MRSFLTLVMLFFFATFVFVQAQTVSEYADDIVRLKNGKTIKGTILKKQFGTVSISIVDSISRQPKTIILQQNEISKIEQRSLQYKSDSVSAYSEQKNGQLKQASAQPLAPQNLSSQSSADLMMSDSQNRIDPIAQTATTVSQSTMSSQPPLITVTRVAGTEDYFDPFGLPVPKRRAKIWNRQIRGYRGFVDHSYIRGVGADPNHRYEFGTSQGFQFNPIFYLGLGVAYDLSLSKKNDFMPVFLNLHVNFLDEFITPFFDTRIGYSFLGSKGFYVSGGGGVSFTRKGKQAFNLGLVYILEREKHYYLSNPKKGEWDEVFRPHHGIALRLSFEY